jgi:hypothetical protein
MPEQKRVRAENNAGPIDRMDPARNRLFLTVTPALLVGGNPRGNSVITVNICFPAAKFVRRFVEEFSIFFTDVVL